MKDHLILAKHFGIIKPIKKQIILKLHWNSLSKSMLVQGKSVWGALLYQLLLLFFEYCHLYGWSFHLLHSIIQFYHVTRGWLYSQFSSNEGEPIGLISKHLCTGLALLLSQWMNEWKVYFFLSNATFINEKRLTHCLHAYEYEYLVYASLH